VKIKSTIPTPDPLVQPEFMIRTDPAGPVRFPRSQRLTASHAGWWFRRMHKVVDAAPPALADSARLRQDWLQLGMSTS